MIPKNIFISYAEEDWGSINQLNTFLQPFERSGKIKIYSAAMVQPGQVRQEVITRALKNADIILIIVSASYFASDYIQKIELPLALSQRNEHGKKVVPIIANYYMWNDTPLKDLAALPSSGQPIAAYDNTAKAWHEVSQELRPLFQNEDTILPEPLQSATRGEPRISVSPLSSPDAVRILMLTANPAHTIRINIEKEHSRITEKIQNRPHHFYLMVHRAVNTTGFKELTEKSKPSILHFSGHGEPTEQYGGLVLYNDDYDGTAILTQEGLDVLFEYLQEHIQLELVLLNACFSEDQAIVIGKHVKNVIGTTVQLNDIQAIAFSVGFYFKLTEVGLDYEAAFKSGRTQAVIVGAKKDYFVYYKNGLKINL